MQPAAHDNIYFTTDFFPHATKVMLKCGINLQDEYYCLKCKTFFTSRVKFKKHVNEKQYGPCNICGKNFASKKSLKVHVNKHTSANYICVVCKLFVYKRPSYLLKHYEKIHNMRIKKIIHK